jgi:hypothetical protein
MKNIVSILVLGLVFLSGKAQTGIGTTTPSPSAKLEVFSNNQGFLPPRVTLSSGSDVNTISNPAIGLLVYNTGNNVALQAGYYYWNGVSWAIIATALGSSQNTVGDIKSGIQTADHNGWIKLDGRAKSTLSASQQARATALGIGANLPDASNTYLSQNGAALGTISGSNSVVLSQANLPNVNFTGTTGNNGNHSHNVDPPLTNTNTTGNHQHFTSFNNDPVGVPVNVTKEPLVIFFPVTPLLFIIFVIEELNESFIGELLRLLAIKVFIAAVSASIFISFNTAPVPPVTLINSP